MKRILFFGALVALLILATSTPAAAQQGAPRFELEAGLGYPLLGEDYDVEQEPSYQGRVYVRVTRTFWIGGVFERFDTEGDAAPLKFLFVDSIPAYDPDAPFAPVQVPIRDRIFEGGDATIDYYGLSARFIISDDPDTQIELVASVGQGTIEHDNPGAALDLPVRFVEGLGGIGQPGEPYTLDDIYISDRVFETDIDLWWEVGAAAHFSLGERVGLRLQLAWRVTSPEESASVLPENSWSLNPSAGLTFRF